jgi:hypothetical protein
VQGSLDEGDSELLALAEVTDRVANSVGDEAIAARLRVIAGEVRTMARWSQLSAGGRSAPGESCLST